MTVLLTFATALAAGWVIDRLAFNGDFTAMLRDELMVTTSRYRRPSRTQRPARRG
jgi:hypothetical protein